MHIPPVMGWSPVHPLGQVMPGQADSGFFCSPNLLLVLTTHPHSLVLTSYPTEPPGPGRSVLAICCIAVFPPCGAEAFPAFRRALRFQAISSTLGSLNKVSDAGDQVHRSWYLFETVCCFQRLIREKSETLLPNGLVK